MENLKSFFLLIKEINTENKALKRSIPTTAYQTSVSFAISLSIISAETYIFIYDPIGLMNEIKINVEFKANYEETNATVPIFTTNMIEYFEQKLNDKVKEEINKIINIEKEKGIDFLYLREKLELKHPYKYEKNKEKFMKLLQKCTIRINSKGSIQTTYDIVESNKHQKGEG